MARNKHRLYIVLYRRKTKPGFHFALMLSPKKGTHNPSDRHCHIYHVINTIQSSVKFDLNGMPPWRYEHRVVDSLGEGMITGRVLIAKLPTHELLATHAERTHDILVHVPLIQDDTQWDCRVWMNHALAALRAEGSNFSTIPDVTDGGQAEDKLKAFGDMAQDRVLKRRPSCVSDVPHIDMRAGRK